MKERLFLKLPVFEDSEEKIGRRKRSEPVWLVSTHEFEIASVAAADLEVLDMPLRYQRLFRHGHQHYRTCIKRDGTPFTLDDLHTLDSLSASEILAAVSTERDHPLALIIPRTSENLPIIERAIDESDGVDHARSWVERLICCDTTILRPTGGPLLSLGLDILRKCLVVNVGFPDQPSLALRMPTLNLRITTDRRVIDGISQELEIEDVLGDGLDSTFVLEGIDEKTWAQHTLAGLMAYCRCKGVNDVPAPLIFSELGAIEAATRRTETAAETDVWLATFLATRASDFGAIEAYVGGLQDLIRARYAALDELAPEDPADALSDLVF